MPLTRRRIRVLPARVRALPERVKEIPDRMRELPETVSDYARVVSKSVGLGVVDALHDSHHDNEPGTRAELLARGFMRGIDSEMDEAHMPQRFAQIVKTSVTAAFETAAEQGSKAELLSGDVARSATHSALDELRDQLGKDGDGPLTRALAASAETIARSATRAIVRMLQLSAFVFSLGIVLAVLIFVVLR